MKDTYGCSLPLPSMRFDLDSLSWRTCEATCLWDLEMSSPSFAEWGMTVSGELFELPTPERPMEGHVSSSLPGLLKTPVASSEGRLDRPQRYWLRNDPGGRFDLEDQIAALLPTPTVMDMGSNYTPEEWEAWKLKQKEAHRNGNGHGASLTQEAISLLPTPTVADTRDGKYLRQMTIDALKRGSSRGLNLNHLVETLWEEMAYGSTGESTAEPLEDGSESSEDQHQIRLSPE